jgi:trehalose 6-phosphate phosphatase
MMSSSQRVPHLSKEWARIVRQIHVSGRIVVFLDFDGTLVRIAPRPNEVRLAPEIRRTLKRLARRPSVTVVVVSGRRRIEIQRFVGAPGIHYFGLYGWEGGNAIALPADSRRTLPGAWTRLSQIRHRFPGVWIEDKHYSLSVHLLKVPERFRRRVRREVRKIMRPLGGALRIFENLRDLEIIPISVQGKGAAVREFLTKPAVRGALPFYFGDDQSDEPAFVAVRKGVSVIVGGKPKTHAQFRLRGPAEVGKTLEKLEAALS